MRVADIAREELVRVNALRQHGHYVYRSGRHGSAYVNKDALYAYPDAAERVAWAMSLDAPADIEVVAGAAVGGAILSQLVAAQCMRNIGRTVRAVYADKFEGGLAFKRGYDRLIQGARVLLVEDIVTTGLTLRQLVELTRRTGGQLAAVVVIVDRGQADKPWLDGCPYHPKIEMTLDSWAPPDCPLCAQGVPVDTDLGHGRDFLAHLAKR